MLCYEFKNFIDKKLRYIRLWKSIIHGVLSRRAQVVFQESFDTPNWRIARITINLPGTEKRWLAWLRKIKGPRSSDP